MKKIICIIKGHRYETQQCPVTGIKQTRCTRCAPKEKHRGISFL
jgi:hypothetical protein